MHNSNLLEQFNQKLSQAISNSPLKDMESNIKAILSSVFVKLDLVTREEFEVQKKVLENALDKIKELELKLLQYAKDHK